MAQKKQQQPPEKLWDRAKWVGSVNVRLKQQEKDEISNNLLDDDGCWQFIQDAATAGYKVSISYSIPEDTYTASLTGTYKAKPNAGVTMSIRHKDIVKALTALKWCDEEAGRHGEWADRFTLLGDDNW